MGLTWLARRRSSKVLKWWAVPGQVGPSSLWLPCVTSSEVRSSNLIQPIVHDDDNQPRPSPSCLSQSNGCNDAVAACEANCSCCLLSEILLAFTLFASKAVSDWTKKTIRETYTSCKVLRDSFEGKVPSVFFSLSFVHSKGWETRRVANKGPHLADVPQQRAHHPHFKDEDEWRRRL